MKTVFLSGKITGDPDYRAKFDLAARELTAAGFAVLNPATLPDGFEYEAYMRICAAMLDECDMVFVLRDFLSSSGALQEVLRACTQQKRVLHYELWRERQSGAAAIKASA